MGAISALIRIRNEFDAPPSQVIREFAAMRYSKRLTAGAMGITTQTLLRLCRKHNIEFVAQCDMVKQCKGHGKGWPKGKPRKQRFRYTQEQLLSLRLVKESCREFEQRTGMPSSTVIRRFGTWREYQNYGYNEKRS